MKTISRYIMTLALLLTAATGAWAQDTYNVTFKANGNTKTVENITLPHTFGCSFNGDLGRGTGELDVIIQELYGLDGGTGASNIPESDNASVTCDVDNGANQYIIVNAPFNGTATVTGYYYNSSFDAFNYSLEIICAPAEPTEPTVTLNDDKTEASFTMPTYDMTVDYELVRDMSVQMQAQVGDDPAKEPRYRVQWNGEKETFEPAELNLQQVLALFSVNDLIENTTLAPTSYFVNIYAVDAEGQPTGDAMTFQNFTFAPGRYAVTATGLPGGPYDGTTALSNIFELFQGYEIKVAAGEYATYYKDEALKVEDEEVELLTITAVESGKAVLSDASVAMPANTPFLVHNNGTAEKTILLIPCNEPNLVVTVANEFIGTLTEKTFTDQEMATGDFYVCNGKEFIKVRGAGTLAANKAYLKVTGNAPASIPFRRSIDVNGGEGTTGIDNVNDNLNDNEATWYDLGGRKLNGKPAQKGVYIKNGRKVVVK